MRNVTMSMRSGRRSVQHEDLGSTVLLEHPGPLKEEISPAAWYPPLLEYQLYSF